MLESNNKGFSERNSYFDHNFNNRTEEGSVTHTQKLQNNSVENVNELLKLSQTPGVHQGIIPPNIPRPDRLPFSTNRPNE